MNVAEKEPVYIIIPVHNRKHTTLKCLEHLDKSGDLQNYHIVVVNDGSTDGTTEAINSLYSDVTVLPGDGNLWWTGAIKKGMEYAYEQGAEYFVWLNDDCLVTEKAIPDLVEFCRQSNLNIIGCQGYELDNPNQISFGGKIKSWKGYHIVNFPENTINKCDLLSGNLVCFSKKLVSKIGYPNPSILQHYGGDSLYLIHARKAKFNIYVDNRNKVCNIYSKSKLAPNRWLISEGKPWDIFKLVFNSHSYLNWKLWLNLFRAEYSVLGYVFFLRRYFTFIILPITIITFLRYLPIKTRWKIHEFKRSIMH